MNYPYTARRIGATVTDYVLIFFLTFAYIYLTGNRQEDGGYQVTGLAAFVPMVIWFFYFVVAERQMNATFGHQLFQLKVVSMDGNELSTVQVLIRRLFDLADIFLCFGLIAFILVTFTQDNQRLGDMAAKTRVVGKKDSYRYPNEQFDFEQK